MGAGDVRRDKAAGHDAPAIKAEHSGQQQCARTLEEVYGMRKPVPSAKPPPYESVVSEPHRSEEQVVQRQTILDFHRDEIASAEIAESRWQVNVAQVVTLVTESNQPRQKHGDLRIRDLLTYINKLENLDRPGVRRLVEEWLVQPSNGKAAAQPHQLLSCIP